MRLEFWRDLKRHGEANAARRDQVFQWFAERGGYPLVHSRPDVEWHVLADQLNEIVIRRVIQHDRRIGDRGRRRDPVLLEELFRLACRYAGQAPGAKAFLDEVGRVLHANVGPQRATPDLSTLAGHLAESIVGASLSTIIGLDLAYVPHRDQQREIDFVLTVGTERIPIEVKYQATLRPDADAAGLRDFMSQPLNRAPFGILITREDAPRDPAPDIVALPLSSLMLLR